LQYNTFTVLQIYNMKKIGIIRESKTPQDNRVPFSPEQCKKLVANNNTIQIVVQPSKHRCFTDAEYLANGIELQEDLQDCDILFGIKEPKIEELIENKTYLVFSHTKKKQAYNQKLMQAFIQKNIRLIDYECLVHEDGQRIVGFGYFAGVVGAHNGMMTYGKKWNLYQMKKVHECKNYEELVHSYFSLKIPSIKIAITGGGRVTSGLLEIMNLLDIKAVTPKEYLTRTFSYPVYVLLKGGDLYAHKVHGRYDREEFHAQPHNYVCTFWPYIPKTDILLNGIYWDKNIARLFELDQTKHADFNISVIADVTCDVNGSVPTNIEVTTIAEPIFGFNKTTHGKEKPFQADRNILDMMTIDNLPNELPRDASVFFGEYLEKFIFADLVADDHTSGVLQRATICSDGKLSRYFDYLSDYAYAKPPTAI
jgi:saccharopine dehydrogenase (NAD+, L-lysine forming)